MRRGEVWWHEPPDDKRRPVLILTRGVDGGVGRHVRYRQKDVGGNLEISFSFFGNNQTVNSRCFVTGPGSLATIRDVLVLLVGWFPIIGTSMVAPGAVHASNIRPRLLARAKDGRRGRFGSGRGALETTTGEGTGAVVPLTALQGVWGERPICERGPGAAANRGRVAGASPRGRMGHRLHDARLLRRRSCIPSPPHSLPRRPGVSSFYAWKLPADLDRHRTLLPPEHSLHPFGAHC